MIPKIARRPTTPPIIEPTTAPVDMMRVDGTFLRIMSKLIHVGYDNAYVPPEILEGIGTTLVVVGGAGVTPKTLIESKSMNGAAVV